MQSAGELLQLLRTDFVDAFHISAALRAAGFRWLQLAYLPGSEAATGEN